MYFIDAAHFVHSAFLGFLWSFSRIFLRAPSGRRRFNVLGALHATTHALVTYCNEGYINAQSVCTLLTDVAKASAGKAISVVLDNARYQRCKLVMAKAEELGIELIFLPPYSPNLNLIERLWKFVKKEALYSKYYETFDNFQNAIEDVLANTDKKHKNALDSLLTLNFQTFDNA